MPDVHRTDADGTDAPVETPTETRVETPVVPARLGRDLMLYTAARIALIVVVAAVLTLFGVPLLIAIGVGIIAALPLAMVLMRPLHNRVSAGLSARSARRHEQRARLRAELRDDPPTEDDDRDQDA